MLRSKLARLGLGMVAPGVRITPAIRRTPRRSPAAARPDAYADLFHAHHLAFGDPAVKIRGWWDLDELARQYESFIRAHEPVLRRWQRGGPAATGREAFADYTRVLTDWRRFPYLDPGLPAELLPDGWIGISAAEEFFALRALLEEPARAYVRAVLSG